MQGQVRVVVRITIFNDIRPLLNENSHLPVKSGHLLRCIFQTSGLGLIMVKGCIRCIHYQFSQRPHFHAVINIIKGNCQLGT